MKYLLLVCVDEPIGPGAGRRDAGPGHRGVGRGDGRPGRPADGRPDPAEPRDATTVRVRDGEVMVIDGPYAETKEQMAGFDIIECADLDEAIEVASKHPMARGGMIEVRPFWADE